MMIIIFNTEPTNGQKKRFMFIYYLLYFLLISSMSEEMFIKVL